MNYMLRLLNVDETNKMNIELNQGCPALISFGVRKSLNKI